MGRRAPPDGPGGPAEAEDAVSFRARLLLAFVAATALPLALFAFGARRESAARMEEEFRRRAGATAETIRRDVRREGAFVQARLAALEERIAGDNRLRLALRGDGDAGREHLLDFAGEVMTAAGLDALQVQSSRGRVLSSGHYRNAYGRSARGLGEGVAGAADGVALATLDRPSGPFLALVAARSFRVGARDLWLVGGLSVRDRLLPSLSRAGGVSVTMEVPDGPSARRSSRGAAGAPPSAPDTLVLDRVVLPHFRAGGSSGVERGEAAFVLAHSLEPLRRLHEGTDRWLAWALAASAALALLLAWRISARISRPLESLASEARRLRLERGEVNFERGRRDEVGELARTLDEAAHRLRARAAQLKEAERRATIGEIARQVNHDIRNGLPPLRNVLRHLEEVARDAPERLAGVFEEREGTLHASLSYLEELAGQYERISSRPAPRACDVNAAARDVARAADPGGGRVRTDLASDLPPATADPVALRRILENLVRNGLEAVEDRPDGRVTISTGPASGDGGDGPDAVRIVVADDGPGIPAEERERIFRDFYTTREEGTGLGLSIVRRLVADLDGTLEVESEPGRGTAFAVELPAGGGP
jgi:signal transduction histidine kinase